MKKYIEESFLVKKEILENDNILQKLGLIVRQIKDCFDRGNKVLIAGNGGSAADSQHFAGEIVGRFKKERKGYPAIALSTDTSIITSWANDYDFDTVFSRQVEALGKEGDVFFGISTSGDSKNVINAVEKAKEMGINTICLLGKDGGSLRNIAGLSLIVPSDSTPRIQECHIMIIHIICEEVEKFL